MDRKAPHHRSITSYGVGVDIQHNVNRVGDGASSTKNCMPHLVMPTAISASAISQKISKRPKVSYGLKTNSLKSKLNNAICINNSSLNNNINNFGSKTSTNTNNNNISTVKLVEPGIPVTNTLQMPAPQPKQAMSPNMNIKSTTTTVRMKNEEAVNDLRQRIPEIEKIFDVHTRIGNGTFSTVLLGTLKKERHLAEESRRKFAIKHHIPTSHPERIMRELQCMANIGGVDNVVGINCCMRCNESVAFIMPYMPHDRFHDFFNKMDLVEVQFYMKNLLVALRRVHRFNVIHRDVKPSNFLYNRSKRQFLLVDFGLAQQAPVITSQSESSVSAGVSLKSSRISAGAAGTAGAGEGNKRAREQYDDDDNEGIKSCLDAVSETGVKVAGNVSITKAHISGVPKRLKCSGPQGDQQVPACAASSTTAAGSFAGKMNENPATFKMPLKQLNEITVPGGKLHSTTTVSSSIGTNSVCQAGSAGSACANANDASSKYNTNRNLNAMNAAKCFCYGNAQVCNICLIKKEIHASRAGTPGYRPPEVLLKYADQTTAVDIWAAGVIFLSILSSVYPFFKAPNDFIALAEMVTIFGDKSIRNTACILDRLVTLSQHSKPLDLRKLCVRFRNRAKFSSIDMLKKHQQADGSCEICKNCDQYFFNCLCAESKYKTECIENDDIFPASAYDLLQRLLEVNPHKRITAEQALQHAFFSEMDKNAVKEQISQVPIVITKSPSLAARQ